MNGCVHCRGNVHTGMDCAFTRKRVLALAEAAQEPSAHWPEARNYVLLPSSSVGVVQPGNAGGPEEVVLLDGFFVIRDQRTFVRDIVGAFELSLQSQGHADLAGHNLQR